MRLSCSNKCAIILLSTLQSRIAVASRTIQTFPIDSIFFSLLIRPNDQSSIHGCSNGVNILKIKLLSRQHRPLFSYFVGNIDFIIHFFVHWYECGSVRFGYNWPLSDYFFFFCVPDTCQANSSTLITITILNYSIWFVAWHVAALSTTQSKPWNLKCISLIHLIPLDKSDIVLTERQCNFMKMILFCFVSC